MARIEHIEQGDLDSGVHPSSVVCAAQLIDDGNGGHLVQLASFGSRASASNRRRHVTQTFQFDYESASTLVGYFARAFGEDLTSRRPDAES